MLHTDLTDAALEDVRVAVAALPVGTMLKLQKHCCREDDLALLRIAHVANDAAKTSLALQADIARKAGYTWADIGEVLGISRQAAEQRFGKAPAVAATKGKAAG